MSLDFVSHDWADRLVHAHDASVYRMVPQGVARPGSLDDVLRLISMARSERTGLTFRTGGTSLSGQAVTHGMLVLLARGWDGFEIAGEGQKITCGPALRGAVANAALAKFDRRIGPDPASIQAACIGGIVANNASGMCCGIEENSYRTIEGMKVVLSTGTVLDTREPGCDERFRVQEPKIYRQLMELRDKVRGSMTLVDLIRRKASTKNTTGYGLQAFLDFHDGGELLSHLMVGSEGTLGFMAELTLRTVPLRPHRASALLSFERMEDACDLTPELRGMGFSAIELLDFASVAAIRGQPGIPEFLHDLNKQGACLLLQAQEENGHQLKEVLGRAERIRSWKQISHRTDFLSDAREQNNLWELRKGIFPAVGARRPRGTSVIIEDVAFPLASLSRGTIELRGLLEKHDYHDAVIYGHARDGNLHFVLSQDFSSDLEVRRYEKFIDEMVDCVAVRYGGALKAEHGTGRNMAPFVEKEWGTEAYGLMRELKNIFDPENIFNPGVVINSNPRVHLEELKPSPLVDELVDACIECGFCEPVCPSQGLTLSPRGRIVLQRELSQKRNAASVEDDKVNYAFQQTCAVDGLCAKACPVGINTGTWVKKHRAMSSTPSSRRLAELAADSMPLVENVVSASLQTAEVMKKFIGPSILESTSRKLNTLLGLPQWKEKLGKVNNKAFAAQPMSVHEPVNLNWEKQNFSLERVVLFRSCVSRAMNGTCEENLNDPLFECCRRAGVELLVIDERGLCCGQPWSSKGFPEQSMAKLCRMVERLFEISQEGKIPVVVDNSPCVFAMFEDSREIPQILKEKFSKLQILDPVDLALQLAERLSISPLQSETRFFPVCSVVKSGRGGKFEQLARKICDKPIFPLQNACCGMAGDRGLWLPELSENAVRKIVWGGESARQGYCSSRTCEVSLSSDGVGFDSVFNALEIVSRPGSGVRT
jgi:D-lactate dehydrogenase